MVERAGGGWLVHGDILCLPHLIVNVFLVGEKGARSGEWTLVDAGLFNSRDVIRDAAKGRFGPDSAPNAIVVTHGHFDHIGAAEELAEEWNIPVYAHELELPYLTGRANYPPPDPSVSSGLMAKISPLYPKEGIDLGVRAVALPDDGKVPPMPDWRWIHSPGHTPGHIALFRERDGVMIVGDAFTTVKQESAVSVLTQEQEVHGPPAYFTLDWEAARESVRRLAALHPSVVISGHGIPMDGEQLERQLEELAEDFDRLAMPDQGRYVEQEHVDPYRE